MASRDVGFNPGGDVRRPDDVCAYRRHAGASQLILRQFSGKLLVLKARKQFHVTWRDRSRVTSYRRHAHFFVGWLKLRPLCLKLILGLLRVVRASLYRSVQAGIWVECGGTVVFTPPFNVEGWNSIRDRNNQR